MYRRPRFLEILIAIREEMAREADFDMDLFVENVRTGHRPKKVPKHSMEKPAANDAMPAGELSARSKKQT
jgi:hypothetical protein